MNTTSFGILGTTVLRIDGDMHESWGKPRERAVLATLLAHPGRPVSIETLLAWAWPRDMPVPQNPTQAFYTHVHRIRKSLQRLPSQPQLRTTGGGYQLDVDKSEIDYERFRELLTAARNHARQHDPRRAATLIEQALPLLRGNPLADLASDRADAWRKWFVHNSLLPANAVLVEALLSLGKPDEALDHLDELERDYPLDLRIAELRLSTLHELARFPEVTAHYLDVYRRFNDDVDVQSATHLRAHYDELMGREQAVLPQSQPVAAPRQLPHDIADFTGRDDLLVTLDAMTTTEDDEMTSRVVILDGMAGVGKTALAIRWGHRMRHRFPDGELFINLNGFSDAAKIEPSAVIDDFLIALGHEPNETMKGRTKELLLSRLLAGRRLLVVLDNARETSQVSGLVRLLSSCMVVVTSRQQLSLLAAETGGRQVHVEPMTTDEGIALLHRRFTSHARIAPEHRSRVVELCGGLPMVIAMLADRMTRVPESELSAFAEQLDRRQLVNDIGQHGDGLANLRAFFSWSYLETAPAERRLFRLLGLHPGPDVSIDAACAYDGRTREETLTSLSKLVGGHLIEQPGALDRYRLHDLLAEFAADCAESDEYPENRRAADRRILTFYFLSARDAIGILSPQPVAPLPDDLPDVAVATITDVADARTWFDRERANLGAAVGYAVTEGYHTEAWQVADPLSTYLDRRGAFESSCRIRALAVTAARSSGERLAEASAQLSLAVAQLTVGEHAEARRSLAEARSIFESDGSDRGIAASLYWFGRVELLRGDPATALGKFLNSLEIVERIDDHEAQCWIHRSLGEAYRAVDQLDQALVHLHDAKMLAKQIGDDSALGATLSTIGSIQLDLGDHAAAAAHCEQALRVVENVDLPVVAQVCIALSKIAEARREPESAIAYARRAVAVCRQTHNMVDEAPARDALGDAFFADADLQHAVAEWRLAADLSARLDNTARSAAIQAKINSVPTDALQLPQSRSGSVPAPDTVD